MGRATGEPMGPMVGYEVPATTTLPVQLVVAGLLIRSI